MGMPEAGVALAIAGCGDVELSLKFNVPESVVPAQAGTQ